MVEVTNDIIFSLKCADELEKSIKNNLPITINGINSVGEKFFVTGYMAKLSSPAYGNYENVILEFNTITEGYTERKILGQYNLNYKSDNSLTVFEIRDCNENLIYKCPKEKKFLKMAKAESVKRKIEDSLKHKKVNLTETEKFIETKAKEYLGKPVTIYNNVLGEKNIKDGVVVGIKNNVVYLCNGSHCYTDNININSKFVIGKSISLNSNINNSIKR